MAKTAGQKEQEAERKPGAANRHAVVIVHGMGEQRPLETLRGFAHAVWGRNTVPAPTPTEDDTWLVPDLRSGLSELARVTTRRLKDGAPTDFYELYWSDLLVDNKLSQINAWLQGLLLRWPHKVPKESWILWLCVWAAVGVVVGLTVYVGLDSSLAALWDLIRDAKPIYDWRAAVISVLFAAALGYFLWSTLITNQGRWVNADEIRRDIWAVESPRQASLSTVWSWAVVCAAPAIAGGLAFWLFPWSVLQPLNSWLLIAAALVACGLSGWVIPVLGDVARYVRTSPDAVDARARIRARGVALLRALHEPVKDERGNSLNPYKRIVVVGHSLGSVVAYDVLRLFWFEKGPTGQNPPGPAALAELKALDDFLRANPDPGSFPVARFREHQGKVASALAKQPNGWLISDFVTLGSPLTHAEFLVSAERSAFEERKAERMLPTCPPMMEAGRKPGDPVSFLYKAGDKNPAHHGAMFAAMRWTNIHDSNDVPIVGDFISGPCARNFGPGVVDLPIALKKPGLLRRVVTHTHYWNIEAEAKASDETGARLGIVGLSKDRKAHLTLLRNVLALRDYPPAS